MDRMLKRVYGKLNRVHVNAGSRWAHEVGTDYWLQPSPGLNQFGAASTATGDELAENGWTSTSLVNTAGAGADFMSRADMANPNHALTNASGSLLKSPSLFGDYAHADAARIIAGMKDLPRKLVAEFWGAMTVHSANEPRSGWGFVEDNGVPSAEADQLAWISSDGTNFQIGRNAGTPIKGALDDANWHLFRIELVRQPEEVRWYIDGARQPGTLPVTGDEFPCAFGFHALTTNRPALGLTHVFYDWEA